MEQEKKLAEERDAKRQANREKQKARKERKKKPA